MPALKHLNGLPYSWKTPEPKRERTEEELIREEDAQIQNKQEEKDARNQRNT